MKKLKNKGEQIIMRKIINVIDKITITLMLTKAKYKI